jgi:phasin family protein
MLQRSKPARSSRRATAPVQVAVVERVATDGSAPAPEAVTVAEPAAVVERPAEAAPSGSSPAAVDMSDPSGSAPAGETDPSGLSVTAESEAPGGVAAIAPPPIPIVTETRAPSAHTMMEMTMQQANKATENMMKVAEEAAEFGRGNVEAFTKATQIYVAGMQDLGKQTFALVQGLTDHAIEGAKALSSVKSLQEAAQIQSTYARTALEKSVAESAKLGESALKLTEQAFAPITARVTLAAEKLTRPSLAA